MVFTDGKPDKKEYRRFRIKTVEGANDFASMAEVLTRRLLRGFAATDKEHGFGAVPDLIIVDGGKGQLSSAVSVLESLGLEDMNIVGPVSYTHLDVYKRQVWTLWNREILY